MEIDLTNNYESWKGQRAKRTIISGTFRLDKATMIKLLSQDFILFKGVKCKIPEKQLLRQLLDEKYGSTFLDLEVIDDEQ